MIFPFGTNESQYNAVKKALENKYLSIQGPPGTGKTNTILNIIANLLLEDKSICVISSNNSAVDNIYEKLEKFNIEYIMANVGSVEKTEKFFSLLREANNDETKGEQNEKINTNDEEKSNHEEFVKISNGYKNLYDNMILYNKISDLEKELFELNAEYNRIKKDLNDKKVEVNFLIKKLSSKSIINFIDLLEKDNILTDLIFEVKKYKKNDYLKEVINLYYLKKKIEIENRIKKLKKKTKEVELENLNERSFKYFESVIKEKKKNKFVNNKDQYHNSIENFPVIGSTSASIQSNKKTGYIFDYLIIDEASQINIYEGLSAISCANNIIVVGDEMQLEPVVTSDVNNELEDIDLKEGFLTLFNKKIKNLEEIMLLEHYRCERSIINFCNMFFYNDKLKIHTKSKGKTMNLEIYNSLDEVEIKANEYVDNDKNVITPYKDKKASTIYSYQGREADHIYISFDAEYVTKYLENENLINVTISRAKDKLTIISKDFSSDRSIVGELFKYIKFHTFDELEYEKKTLFVSLYNNRKIKCEGSAAEKIIVDELNELIKNYKYFEFVRNYRLTYFVHDDIDYEKEERKFIKGNSHIDILIYNKADKCPVLAIEVDGHNYHKDDDSKRRDKLKNNILQKNKIKLLRLNTQNETNERNRIISVLKSELEKIS